MENMRLVVVLVILRLTVTNSLRGKRASLCPSHSLDIEHGSHQLETTNSVKYNCMEGYSLYGAETLYCVEGSWNNIPPKCIINTCQNMAVREPLRVQEEYNGAVLRFSCAVMTVLEGSEVITCNGKTWSDSTPICKPAAPATSCAFENGLCGWDHHDASDVRWTWHMGSTKSRGTGPKHDHTYGVSGQGHYMYFETTSPARQGHSAILMSPLYPANYSRSCFTFWYHILARGDVAQLQVFVKPERANIKDLSAKFSVKENKGDKWLNHTLQVPQLAEPFQIVFVATKGSSRISDIAIDDVRLYNCPEYFTTTKSTSSTTILNPPTSTSVSKSVVSRTVPVVDTTASLTKVSSEPGLSSASPHSTSAQLPVSPITEVRSSAVTTVSTATATIKATGQLVKSSVTTKQRTSQRIPLTSTLRSFTNTLPAPLQKNISLSTITKSSVYLTESTRKTDRLLTSPSNNAKHFIEPAKKRSPELIYIVVGIGVVILAVIVVGVWVYFRRRRKIGRSMDSIEAVNPLYMAVNNDGEDTVNIWHR